ncbi:MAG: glutamate 5-kinase [Omnitrophica bacterium RIFCSPHIGHO2_02_FULL_63_14]|nr:MAG: glutamate 5-kinase [Omnitrophica bacterium RIFCSPHIGHO2_02_FULL_63_14]
MRKKILKGIRRVVVKIGTSVLTRGGCFNRAAVRKLARDLAKLLDRGVQVYVVSSGAIGAGMSTMGLERRPKRMQELQAAAAVGQRCLMECYERAFRKTGRSTAQVLLTWDDLARTKGYLNAKRTLEQIRAWGLVPVINENDTVATDEIRFGDNDRLSSLLAILVEADLLVILSDTDGLYVRHQGIGGPSVRAGKRIPIVEKIETAFSHVVDSHNAFTVGGMRSKLKAVQMSVHAGIPVLLADGRQPRILERLFGGDDLGTLFVPKKARGAWLRHFLKHIRSGPVSYGR